MRLRWLVLGIVGACVTAHAQDDLDAAFRSDTIVIVASRHACYRFDIYLATSMAQKRRGLMHVRALPASTGMLFVYANEDMRSMWMKNSYISLDIAFARSDGTIVNIARGTEPLSLESIRSAAPVTYVLELNAGITASMDIDAGSRLLWGPVFEQYP